MDDGTGTPDAVEKNVTPAPLLDDGGAEPPVDDGGCCIPPIGGPTLLLLGGAGIIPGTKKD